MKRAAATVLALILALGLLCGCGEQTAEEDGRLKVVTTLFPYYDFVRAIGGESGTDLCKAVSFDQQVGTGDAIGQNGVFQ